MSKPITRSNSRAESNESGLSNAEKLCTDQQDFARELKLVNTAIGLMKTSLNVVLEKLEEQSQLIRTLKEENSALILKISSIEGNLQSSHDNDIQISREIDQAEPSTEPLTEPSSAQSASINLSYDDYSSGHQMWPEPEPFRLHGQLQSQAQFQQPIFPLRGSSRGRGRGRGSRFGRSRGGFQRRNSNQSLEQNGSQTSQMRNKVLIIGDSIIKNIKPNMLSSKSEVIKKSFPCKKIEDISNNLASLADIIPNCNKVILHLGTNNIQSDTTSDIQDKYTALISEIQRLNVNCRVYISSLTTRSDIANGQTEIDAVNAVLKNLCASQNCSFINNKNIDSSCLNGSNLHLNQKGTAFLAMNFIRSIRGKRKVYNKKNKYQGSSDNSQNFHGSAIQKIIKGLSELILPNK